MRIPILKKKKKEEKKREKERGYYILACSRLIDTQIRNN
jgi:hypothetical protein